MTAPAPALTPLSQDALARLAAVIESRKAANGGDPAASYVARLLHQGPDAFLKKIGEEATEVVMAAMVGILAIRRWAEILRCSGSSTLMLS